MLRSIVSITETATDQLDALRKRPPLYWSGIAERIEDQIDEHIARWMPLSERGGDGTIKWCDKISLYCNADVYRLKNPEEIGEWRIFFFLLDLEKPPKRVVAEIVERKSNEQCYNDLKQPHVQRLRLLTSQFKNSNQMRLMR